MNSYELLDSGNALKLERFGPYILLRPCAQALWKPSLPDSEWKKADLIFSRDPENHWNVNRQVPKEWMVQVEDLQIKVIPSDFGHVGLFPEHAFLWKKMQNLIEKQKGKKFSVLNLFAYTGAASLAAAKAGAHVCHLDASYPMIQRAKENAQMNGLQNAPIRWIADDVTKFLRREVKRGHFYEGIVLDPPTFGRGPQGEIFKLENDISELLFLCKSLLSPDAQFLIFSTHTPGISSCVIDHLLQQSFQKLGKITSDEMILPSKKGYSLPCGYYGIWQAL